MSIKLLPYPRQHVVPSPTHKNEWQINELPAFIELLPETGELPDGWVLIRATLLCNGADRTTRLLVELENGEQFPVPLTVTLKGTIIELVQLPKNSRRLLLEPMQSIGFFQLNEPKIKAVSWLERITKMANRVTSLYRTHTYARLQTAGLHFYIPLLDLAKAYQIASLFRTYSAPPNYLEWLEKFDLLLPSDRQQIIRQIKKWRSHPQFKVIIFAGPSANDLLQQTLASLEKQLYRHFKVILLAHKGSSHGIATAYLQQDWLSITELPTRGDNLAVDALATADNAESSWLLALRPGERLAEHALFWLASEAIKHPDAAFIYSDYDFINAENCRIDPVFNPDWSPELLRSTNYMANAAAIRMDNLARAGGLMLDSPEPPNFHDLFFRCTEQLPSASIRHIPAMLWHLHDKRQTVRHPIAQEAETDLLAERALALAPHETADCPCSQCTQADDPVTAHLQRLGVRATVQPLGTTHFHVCYQLPKQPPKVSIIVPTRDAYEHLFACIESLLNKSSYQNFELIIVDNQSSEKNALRYLRQKARHPKVKVMEFPHSFNYSRMNNLAASVATGEVLCLLNNDTEVISPNWLEEMLGHLGQPQVAIVGAKLYYSDGRVQHAGDTVGPGGCANHLHRLIGRKDPGYCGRAQLAQDLSAVTGACLLTWKHVFLQVGGLDEHNLPVSFNDVDYCLRVRDAGYRVIWTPHAEMYHHESVSRNKEPTPEKLARAKAESLYFRKRWAHLLWHDPFYNPNLSYVRPDFSLSHAPVIQKPW